MQKLKVILAVAGLLLIGFIGGFLTNRQLVQQRVHELRQLGEGKGFGERFLERIETEPEQELHLREIFEEYGPRFRELNASHRLERTQLADSLFQEVTPLLTEDQLQESQRWRRMLSRSPHMKMKRRRPHENPHK